MSQKKNATKKFFDTVQDMQFALNDWENIASTEQKTSEKQVSSWREQTQQIFDELKQQLEMLSEPLPPATEEEPIPPEHLESQSSPACDTEQH